MSKTKLGYLKNKFEFGSIQRNIYLQQLLFSFTPINIIIECTNQPEEKSGAEEDGDDFKIVIKEAKAASGVSISKLKNHLMLTTNSIINLIQKRQPIEFIFINCF